MSTDRYDLIAQMRQNTAAAARLLYVSTAKYGGDWHSVPHTHACAELFYVLGGRGNFMIEDRTCPVRQGDLVVVNPHVRHTETSLNANPLEYIVLGVDGLELSVTDQPGDQFYIASFGADGEDTGLYLKDMLWEMETQAPGCETVCQNLLEILLIRLMRISNYSARLLPAGGEAGKESAMVRRYIDSHFKENLTLDQLAEVAHINKYHLVHMFTRDFGVSPVNYLLSRRIRDSRYLLQTTDHSMSQIAQIMGFSSSSYFSQSFRRAMGISPSEYRARSRHPSETP